VINLSAGIHPAAHVSTDAVVSGDCVVEPGAVIGARAILGPRVCVGANAVLIASSGSKPNSGVVLQADVKIGAGAVVHAGVTVAAGAVVLPGSVVSRSVPHKAIVQGNPAAIVGYVDAESSGFSRSDAPSGEYDSSQVNGASLHRMKVVRDLRGNLTVGDFERSIPFRPLRYFMVFDVPSLETRGEHAHRECHQFLICVKGNCSVVADDGRRRAEFLLTGVDLGLHLAPMTWGIQYKYSNDAVLLVFASHHYDPEDYIRDYDQFLSEKSA
jgi:UDP-2-acetamido-3-amino-2,3-dideoxy-glucuronate N-acetyltransferase